MIRSTTLAIAGCVTAVALFACSSNAPAVQDELVSGEPQPTKSPVTGAPSPSPPSDTKHFTVENAHWLANTGYGVLSAETEAYFKTHLEQLSGGDKAKPLVFFCLRNCWMSWNASKRAMTYGYTNVNWFSEGTDAWQEIGQPVTEARPEP